MTKDDKEMTRDHGQAENPDSVQRSPWHFFQEEHRASAPLVSVVIPCYNQGHFLGEAIESVLSQSYPNFEIIVVDDGSTDNTSEVAERYPRVRLVRQENQGLSGALNSGLACSEGEYVVFLDADDRLVPEALEAGLECFEDHPESAFVSGHFRYIAGDGSPLPTHEQSCPDKEHYLEMLRGNYLGMHSTYMYRRAILEDIGGFDTSFKHTEDSELQLRIGRKFPVYCHNQVVAEYRRHDANMSGKPELMLNEAVAALRLQWKHVKGNKQYEEALKSGIRACQDFWGMQLVYEARTHVRKREYKRAVRDMLAMLRRYPRGFASLYQSRRLARRILASERHIRELQSKLKQLKRQERRLWSRNPPLWLRIENERNERGTKQRKRRLPVGEVDFGDLRRLRPIGRRFGASRGLPIDRYYIENFLARQAEDIQGRVLEIQDDDYTRKYGGRRVKVSDVLDVIEDNPQATIIADLTRAEHIPSEVFDCIILTQTLHLIYDVRSAIQTLHRILRPGGVLLATFPGISQIYQDYKLGTWYWAFTTHSAKRLFGEVFPEARVEVEAHGNVLATMAFMYGLTIEELRQKELDYHDPDYELLITLRAVKPEAMP